MAEIQLDEQETVETACPECGSEPTDESVAEHKLSWLGYAHDDQLFECSSCDNQWAHGVPIGSSDFLASDLKCENPKCERDYCRVHRAHVYFENGDPKLRFDKKCPECYYFGRFGREPDGSYRVLLGYPDITGDTSDAEPYGYVADEEPGQSHPVDDCGRMECIIHGTGTAGCPNE